MHCVLHRQRSPKFSKLLWPFLSALRGKGLNVAFSFQKFPRTKWHSFARNMFFASYSLRRRALEKGSDSNFILKQTNTVAFPVFQHIRDNHFSFRVFVYLRTVIR